jgi:hypothetical protein
MSKRFNFFRKVVYRVKVGIAARHCNTLKVVWRFLENSCNLDAYTDAVGYSGFLALTK